MWWYRTPWKRLDRLLCNFMSNMRIKSVKISQHVFYITLNVKGGPTQFLFFIIIWTITFVFYDSAKIHATINHPSKINSFYWPFKISFFMHYNVRQVSSYKNYKKQFKPSQNIPLQKIITHLFNLSPAWNYNRQYRNRLVNSLT